MNVQFTGHAVARTPGIPCDDAWTLRERGGTVVAALADGVGSSREGGTAARRAVDMLADYCLARPRAWTPRRALAEFTAQINRHLYSESLARHGQPELACTLSAVVLEGGRLYGCNVGDSPVFHWRKDRLHCLSERHALRTAGMEHVLTQALGLEPEVAPSFFEADLAENDIVLLCSDGVTTALSEPCLIELCSRRAAARSVVSAARSVADENPSLSDDTCAIVVEVVDRGPAAEAGQPLEVPPALHPGDRFDTWSLVLPLDPDHRVWVADDAAGARGVLKFPPLDAQDNQPLRDAFLRETWNATRLISPDLVRAWTPDTGTLRYYAMEHVDAPTLRAVLRAGRLGIEEARALGEFLLRVGQFLLGHELAHGDLKPENILVLRSGALSTFRLLDLGSAAGLFSVTSRAGTPSYLAPERFRGGAVAERTEIFALGVTLYEAVTGVYPYGEVERFQTPRFDSAAARPTRLNPAVPPWFEAVILRAIDADPERRYQHFSEMAYDLEHPAQVRPHHRKDASLLERNPLLFYKLLSALLFGAVLALLILLARAE